MLAEVTVATLAITTPATAAGRTSPITVTASVGTAQLVEYQTTDLIFTVANTSDRSQQFANVTLTSPAFLTVTD